MPNIKKRIAAAILFFSHILNIIEINEKSEPRYSSTSLKEIV